MSRPLYTYLPEIKQSFRCRVPMEGIRQVFLVDGLLQDVPTLDGGILLSDGEGGKGLNLTVQHAHVMDSPLQIISVRKEDLEEKLQFTNCWEIEDGAVARIVVCDHTLEEFLYQTERFTRIHVGRGASLDILFMQNEHKASFYQLNIQAELEESARLDCHIISLYGGTTRNRIDVNMAHPHAECSLNGLYLVDGEQKVEYTVNVNHLSGGCKSQQLFKGILDNHASGSFKGIIKVQPQAQKTEAYQANHNLLLTKEAKVHTQPQLEIYADDVMCSHGATIGRLDEEGLFYMRSRGIPLHEAQMLQQMAFVQDVLQKITTQTIRERLERMVESRLRGEFSKCNHCTMHCC